jgi:murein L,D-transpeptidase YafK
MNKLRIALLAMALGLSAISPRAVASSPDKGVDEIRIDKSDHKLELVAAGRVVKSYQVAIGSGGTGPKRMEGDKVTPVGTYRVTGRWKGLFHRFLVVSYPNDDDKRRFAELKKQGLVPPGLSAGFGIGIHGTGHKEWNGVHKESDWTHGCVALDDDEIDELSSLVKDGTKIVITD